MHCFCSDKPCALFLPTGSMPLFGDVGISGAVFWNLTKCHHQEPGECDIVHDRLSKISRDTTLIWVSVWLIVSSVGWWWCRTARVPPCWDAFHGCWITTSCPTTHSCTSWPTAAWACSLCCCSWSKAPTRGARSHVHFCTSQLERFLSVGLLWQLSVRIITCI